MFSSLRNTIKTIKRALKAIKKTLLTDVRDLFTGAPTLEVRSTLEVAKLQKILSVKELETQSTCSHVYEFDSQIWAPVARRKYELRNSMVCVKCNSTKLEYL